MKKEIGNSLTSWMRDQAEFYQDYMDAVNKAEKLSDMPDTEENPFLFSVAASKERAGIIEEGDTEISINYQASTLSPPEISRYFYVSQKEFEHRKILYLARTMNVSRAAVKIYLYALEHVQNKNHDTDTVVMSLQLLSDITSIKYSSRSLIYNALFQLVKKGYLAKRSSTAYFVNPEKIYQLDHLVQKIIILPRQQ